jgi:hypothetical protein
MTGKTSTWRMGVALVGVVFLAVWMFGAPKPKAANVQLRAYFLELTNPDATGYDFYVNKILNDTAEPYVTNGNGSISVWITPDNGELFFKFEHHADRAPNVIFPLAAALQPQCGYLPDTIGLYENLPEEPVDFFRFNTYNSDAFAGPKLNLLDMAPWTVTNPNTQQIRLWTTVCTTERHYFLLNYNNFNVDSITGIVQVTAYDNEPADGQIDRWVFEPIAGTEGIVQVVKQEGNGKNQFHCDFGVHFMPFVLVLERIS